MKDEGYKIWWLQEQRFRIVFQTPAMRQSHLFQKAPVIFGRHFADTEGCLWIEKL